MWRKTRFRKTLLVLLGSSLLAGPMPIAAQEPGQAEPAAEAADEPASEETPPAAAPETVESPDDNAPIPAPGFAGFEGNTGPHERSVFRTTGAPYSGVSLGGSTAGRTLRSGDFHERVSTSLPGFRLGLPTIGRGFAPSEANLKAGPLYLKLRSLTAAALFSDNVNASSRDRRAGVISIVQLNGTILAQLSEHLQLALSGSLVYLPLRGKVGLNVAGLNEPAFLGLAAAELLTSQISYDTLIASWPVRFADDFHISRGRFADSTRDDFVLLDGERFNEVDRAGRYEFGARGGGTNSRSANQPVDRREQNEFLVYSNVVSAATDRLLPSDVRLRASVFHENLWYNQGNRGLPSGRDAGRISLTSERAALRFKPYIRYEIDSIEGSPGVYQRINAGIFGPITDQLRLRAEAGYLLSSNGHDSLLFLLSLEHIAGPLTRERLTLGRTVTDFDQEIATYASYELHQILGPGLNGSLFAHYANLVGNTRGNLSNERDEIRAGVGLEYFVSPRTQIDFAATEAHITSSPNSQTQNTFTARLSLNYHFTDSFVSRLLYQYQRRESSVREGSYYENVVYFTLTKLLE